MKTTKPFIATLTLVASLSAGCIETEDDESSAEEELALDVDAQHHRGDELPNGIPVRNASGFAATVSTAGSIDLSNGFFKDLGTNGRRCVSCHQLSAGWSITPEQLQRVFDKTRGGVLRDSDGAGAVFRLVDGANSPNAKVASLADRRRAYSMLLTKGLIRVGLPIPPNAEFELVAVDDPYRYASAAELSLFRRPLTIANLKFLSTIMWDGRESQPNQPIAKLLENQANTATVTHAEGAPLSQEQRRSITQFVLGINTAQIWDDRARHLHAAGAKGGPDEVIDQEFYIGINDNFGDSRTGAPFTPVVFDLYDSWTHLRGGGVNEARRAVARGQALFNNRRINISGVSGINDEPVFGAPAVLAGTCTTCHNTPNGGNHSVIAPLNIGLSDASRRTPDMPLYTLRNKTTRQTVQVTDPGRAMISGRWKDIGRFKGPTLRALPTRAPYFHNGSAADLNAVVDFYNTRFNMGLSRQEKSDLVAFLRTL
jgi:hypothetical protein